MATAMTSHAEERFWKYVAKSDGCWLWTGCLFKAGYGSVFVDSRLRGALAHRISWELTNGAIPKGMCLLHECDKNYPVGDITYRRCVNPAHLRLGTRAENQDDLARKGRNRKKLTGEQATEIRVRHAAGEGAYVLAKIFSVSTPTIYSILYRKTFKHVP